MYYSSLDIHNAEKRQILLNIHHPYPQPWSGAKREREKQTKHCPFSEYFDTLPWGIRI